MRNRSRVYICIIMFAMLIGSCGKESNEDTTSLNAAEGMSFQKSSEDTKTDDGLTVDIEISMEDLEGRTKEIVVVIRSANVYAKPTETASVIGAIAEGSQVGIYGLSEQEKWVVIEYNGRVGYISSDVIQEEAIQNQEVILLVPQNPNEEPGTILPETPANGETETPDDSETEIPEDSETEIPDDSEIEIPEDSETEIPDDSETEIPEDSETEIPDDSETETPEDSEAETPDDSETETPNDSEPETPSDSEIETPEDSETEHPEDTEISGDSETEIAEDTETEILEEIPEMTEDVESGDMQ